MVLPEDLLRILRKRWLLIITITLLVGGTATLVSVRATPTYTSKSSVFVALPSGNTPGELFQGSTYTQGLMASFAALAKSPAVMTGVIEDLDLATTPVALARKVTARVVGDTVILDIAASDGSPVLAADVANSVVDNLAKVAAKVSPKKDNGRATVVMSPLGKAVPPRYPTSPNTRRNLVAGMLAGLLLGVAAAIVRERLDVRVRAPRDVTSNTEVPLVAEIADSSDVQRGRVAMRDSPMGSTAETIRKLRSNLEFLHAGSGPFALAVTSAEAGEGKSTIALNLALACADSGVRTLLVDADLRKPTIADRLGLDNTVGLSTVLAGRSAHEESIQSGGRRLGLDVLPSGPIPPNPAELLGSPAMSALLENLLRHYDVVLLDTPPVLPVADAALLSRQVSGAIVVVRLNQTRKASIGKAEEALNLVGAKVLGIVLNFVPRPSGSYYANSGPRDGDHLRKAPHEAVAPIVQVPAE
jgi:capsular exopolysaccharide synthesis family protein